MPKLTIITACIHPENLPYLAVTIAPGRDLFDLTWRVVFDGARCQPVDFPGAIVTVASHPRSIVGNHQKNDALDHTQDGWVYFLDDDNLVHPDFFRGHPAGNRRDGRQCVRLRPGGRRFRGNGPALPGARLPGYDRPGAGMPDAGPDRRHVALLSMSTIQTACSTRPSTTRSRVSSPSSPSPYATTTN